MNIFPDCSANALISSIICCDAVRNEGEMPLREYCDVNRHRCRRTIRIYYTCMCGNPTTRSKRYSSVSQSLRFTMLATEKNHFKMGRETARESASTHTINVALDTSYRYEIGFEERRILTLFICLLLLCLDSSPSSSSSSSPQSLHCHTWVWRMLCAPAEHIRNDTSILLLLVMRLNKGTRGFRHCLVLIVPSVRVCVVLATPAIPCNA